MKPGEFFRSHYVISSLGTGGMSQVWLAFDCRSYAFVAIKALLERYARDETVKARLRREADIYRKLRHKNLVGFVESGEHGGQPFVVQEFLRGTTLRAVIDSFPAGLPFQAALQIATDLAEALRVAHDQTVVHRDVQPDNVMVDHEGEAKLFDFGIAYAQDELVVTQEGTIMGTVVYSSPEQNVGQAVDDRTDLYSLGAILFEMLTGRRMLQATTMDQALEAQRQPVPDLRTLNPEVPARLDAITHKLVALDAEARYQNVQDLLVDLGTLRQEASSEEIERLFGHPFFRKLREARALLGEGKHEAAVKLAQELEANYQQYQIDDLSKVYYLLGRASAALGKHDASARYFERALFADPGNVNYALDFAAELIKEKRLPKARGLLEQVAARDPENPLARGLSELVALPGGLPEFPPAPAPGAPGTDDDSWLGSLSKRLWGS